MTLTTDISKTIKENEFQLKIIPKEKPQAPDGLAGSITKHLRKMSVLHNTST